MKKLQLFLLVSVLAFVSCGDYQKLLKSNDADLKYNRAVQYFNKKDFVRASTLFDAISSYYKGSDRSDSVLNFLAKSYVGQKDYFTGSEYFRTYLKTYPKGKFAVESKFMIGYCYYMDSPDARLDQAATINAVKTFQEFLEFYPESDRVGEANKLLEEMNNKLAYKAYLNAKLYFNLGNYGGNNYESCVITAQNALKNFPATIHREELSMLILDSKYQLATQSFEEKKIERYRNTIDEYYNYVNEFPQGKFKKQADKIFNESKKIAKD